MESFYVYNNSFDVFTLEHFISFIVWITIGIALLYFGRTKWNEDQQRKYITWFVLFYLLNQWADPFLKSKFGHFEIEKDLPLHLCNVTPLFMLLVMHYKSRFWFGIFFFWIMCASAQALFTPTLEQSFPHFEHIRYWAVHAGLTFTALYGVVVYGWKLRYKDVIYSFIALNVGTGIMHIVNMYMNSNYWFTMAKPASPTFYDLLGPWPDYMFQLEPITLLIFSIMYLIVTGFSKIKLGTAKTLKTTP
jgi:hypothetical integral membrane protein (TIGR02206 family)